MKKLFIILAIVSFGFLVFQSCKKENNEAINRKKDGLVKKKIDFNNFMQDKTAKLYYDKSIKKLKKNNNKNLYDSINHFTILTDSILFIQDNDYKSYTFKILFNNQTQNNINTLLLSKEDNEYVAFIINYYYNTSNELIDTRVSQLSNFSINNLTNKDYYPPYCLCFEINEDGQLIIKYCVGEGGDSGNNNSDNTSNNGGDGSDNGTGYDNHHYGNDTDYGYGQGGSVVNNSSGSSSSNSSEANNNMTHDHITYIPIVEASDNLYNIFVASNINHIPIAYIYNPNNRSIIQTLYNFLQQYNNSQEAINMVNNVLNQIVNNNSNTTPAISLEGSDDMNFDQSFWDNYQTPQQARPSFQTLYDNFPKLPNGGMMPANQVFNLIGGAVQSEANLHGWTNACATRMSRALNYSGINISYISGKTLKGNDNKNYIVGARDLYEYLIKIFGQPDIILNGQQVKTDGSGFYTQAIGKKGIYVMLPNYPGYFGASEHVDIFDGSSFNHKGYFNPSGGVYRVVLWILN